MSSVWKWILAVVILLGVGLTLYFYYTAPSSKQEASTTIVHRRTTGDSTSASDQDLEPPITSLEQDVKDIDSLVGTTELDSFTQELEGF